MDTLIYVLSITTLTMVVVTETSLQAKAEIFTTWFFTEKDPCFFFLPRGTVLLESIEDQTRYFSLKDRNGQRPQFND